MRIVVHLNAVENFTTPPVPAAVEGGADSPGADPERSSFDIVFWRSSSRRSNRSTLQALRSAKPDENSPDSDAVNPEARCRGSPMPRGERIAKPTERWTRSAGFFVPAGSTTGATYDAAGSAVCRHGADPGGVQEPDRRQPRRWDRRRRGRG